MKRRSKIRCCNCNRRGRVRTEMRDIRDDNPTWQYGRCAVPVRHCLRCHFMWRDHVAEEMLDEHRRRRKKSA